MPLRTLAALAPLLALIAFWTTTTTTAAWQDKPKTDPPEPMKVAPPSVDQFVGRGAEAARGPFAALVDLGIAATRDHA